MTHSETTSVATLPPNIGAQVATLPLGGVTRARRPIVIPGADTKPAKRPWGRPRRDIPVNEYVESGGSPTPTAGKPLADGGGSPTQGDTTHGTVPLDFVPSTPEQMAEALADPVWRICSGAAIAQPSSIGKSCVHAHPHGPQKSSTSETSTPTSQSCTRPH